MPEQHQIERFLAWVDKTDSCWIWKGGRNGSGYGNFRLQRHQTVPAHRASYLLFVGQIPKKMQVLHSCDNRTCVNPAHLRLGTHAENMREASARGRIVSGPGHFFSRVKFVGEQRPQSKLTNDGVKKMRQQYASGVTPKALAKEFGVHENTVFAVVKRRTWRHIN